MPGLALGLNLRIQGTNTSKAHENWSHIVKIVSFIWDTDEITVFSGDLDTIFESFEKGVWIVWSQFP